jgi:uncharacterized cupredoxin-like copper-binding protein
VLTRRSALPALAVLLLVAAPACTKKKTTTDGSGNGTVAVTDTGSACEVAKTELIAGKTTFDVTNKGGDVTEVYVYGHHDEIKGEVENIGPGTSRDFTVDLAAGDYEVACKQGQQGDGIRTRITVSGAGGPASAGSARQVEVEATEFTFAGLESFTAKAGDAVTFELKNEGKVGHEFELFGPDGKEVGEIGEQEPGKEGKVTLTLPAAGTYQYVCDVDDHKSRGMKGTFEVA